MAKVVVHHRPETQRIVRLFEASLWLLRAIEFVIENKILGGLEITRRHRERANYCNKKHPNYWCAHVESSRSGIGQYRLTQGQQSFLTQPYRMFF
jgi:hypothetical protein